MKKALLFIAVLAFSLLLVSCKDKIDPAQAKLDGAYDSLNALISDPTNITGGFEVPVTLANGVTAVWTSSNPGVATVGTASSGFANITVNRPAFGAANVNVTLSVVLSLASELDDTKTLTKEWSVVLTVKANTVEAITVDNIADILAITDPSYDGVYQVALTGLTIFAKGQDASFAYDGTGIIMVYGGNQESLLLNKVYNINATIDWYFGLWELTKWTATEQASATPQTPPKEVITSVNTKLDAMITAEQNKYSGLTASAGNMEPIYATVTGKVYMIPGDSGSYNTYIVDTAYDTTQTWVAGSAAAPARGLMVYYNTEDFTTLRLYDGVEVTISIVIYTYRSNNQAFAIYYTGGPTGVVANLTDEKKLEIDAKGIDVPVLFEESTTFAFPTAGLNGSTIAWTSSDATVINTTTGVVTAPATGGTQVELTATVTFGALTPVVKTILVTVGEFEVTDIADLYGLAVGTKVRLQGILTGGHSSFYFIQDATGGVGLYPLSAPSQLRVDMAALAFGVKVDVIGTVNNSFRGYLEIEINKVENVKVMETTPALPAAVDIDAVTPFTLAGLVDYRSERVNLTGMQISSLSVSSFGTYTFGFVNPVTGVTLDGVFDNRSNQFTATTSQLEALKVGDIVDIKGAVLAANAGLPRLQFHYAGQIVASAVTYTDQQYADGAKTLLKNLPTVDQEVTANLALPVTGLFGSTIAWTSSHPAVIAVDGTVTRPAAGQADVTVTLGYTVTKGTASTTEATVAVVVKAMPTEPVAGTLMIYEAYGGGGNSGSYWMYDYVVLYNGTNAAIDLTGYSIQYASATGTTWSNKTDLTGSIAAGAYYVIRQAKGSGGTAELPRFDVSGVIAMAGTNFKVALVNSTTFLTGANPSADPSVVDFLGVGSADGFEVAAAGVLSNTQSAQRITLVDNNNNSTDFAVVTNTAPNHLDYLTPQS